MLQLTGVILYRRGIWRVHREKRNIRRERSEGPLNMHFLFSCTFPFFISTSPMLLYCICKDYPHHSCHVSLEHFVSFHSHNWGERDNERSVLSRNKDIQSGLSITAITCNTCCGWVCLMGPWCLWVNLHTVDTIHSQVCYRCEDVHVKRNGSPAPCSLALEQSRVFPTQSPGYCQYAHHTPHLIISSEIAVFGPVTHDQSWICTCRSPCDHSCQIILIHWIRTASDTCGTTYMYLLYNRCDLTPFISTDCCWLDQATTKSDQ